MIDFAYADGGAAASSPMSTLVQFAPMVLILIVFWFLVMRPQQQKMRQQQQMLSELKKGDRIITTGGILGKIMRAGDEFLSIEIAPNTVIEIERSAVAGKVDAAGKRVTETATAVAKPAKK